MGKITSAFTWVCEKLFGLGSRRREHEAYIREAARKRGINPDIAVAVAATEGLHQPWAIGDRGTSYGDFQLHYRDVSKPRYDRPGLGDEFTRLTGLHASDQATWKQQVDFALDYALRHGWSAWHGWKGNPRAGLPWIR